MDKKRNLKRRDFIIKTVAATAAFAIFPSSVSSGLVSSGKYSYNAGQLNHVTPEQLEWLENDLAKTNKPTVVFSHQVPNLSISNKDELLPILVNSRKVIACFSGHHHGNWHIEEDGINHIQD